LFGENNVWGKVVWGNIVWGNIVWGTVVLETVLLGTIIWGEDLVPNFYLIFLFNFVPNAKI
jgi:hypothetical protein